MLPFAAQQKGRSIQEAVDDYHRRAEGKAVIDYAFHLIVADATKDVTQRELPALIDKGYTSFKIYMTYDDLKLNDRQIIEVLAVARRHGAMTMIHAENSDCIAWLTEQLLDAGLTAPRYHGSSRPMAVEREATHRAIALAELVDTPILIVHVSGREAVEQIHWARGRGLADPCGDLPAVPVPERRGSGHRSRRPDARRALHLQSAAARQGQPAVHLERARRAGSSPSSRPTTRPST